MRYLENTNVWTRELIGSEAATRVLGISLFVALTALGAFVRIPLPFTPRSHNRPNIFHYSFRSLFNEI